jgi:hypothetical protein
MQLNELLWIHLLVLIEILTEKHIMNNLIKYSFICSLFVLMLD